MGSPKRARAKERAERSHSNPFLPLGAPTQSCAPSRYRVHLPLLLKSATTNTSTTSSSTRVSVYNFLLYNTIPS